MVVYHGVSHRQACKAVSLPRSTQQYQPRGKDDSEVIEALKSLTEKHPAIGFWSCHYRLRRAGHAWNHKRVYRVYTNLALNIRRRVKRRLPERVKHPLLIPEGPNKCWSIDFMHDSLWGGRRFRLLNIIDDYSRELLSIEVDTCLPAQRVIRVLERLKETRSLPGKIRMDNGPEFISSLLAQWCFERNVELIFTQPGKPTQNALIERCNGSIRRELLNANIFYTLSEVRAVAEEYMEDYNNNRPHESLEYKTPKEFVEAMKM